MASAGKIISAKFKYLSGGKILLFQSGSRCRNASAPVLTMYSYAEFFFSYHEFELFKSDVSAKTGKHSGEKDKA